MKVHELKQILDEAIVDGDGDLDVYFEDYRIGGERVFSAKVKHSSGQFQDYTPPDCFVIKG